MAAPEYVIVGRVRNAHGIRGEVVVEPLTGDPDTVFAVGRQLVAGTADGAVAAGESPGPRALTIRRSVPFKGGWILRFEEIHDRTAADLWRTRYLLLPSSSLAPPAPGEIYFHDLVGLRVERVDGAELGRVDAFYEMPQGLVLEVRTPAGTTMLPYRPEVVSHVDLDRRTLVVDPPDGLFE